MPKTKCLVVKSQTWSLHWIQSCAAVVILNKHGQCFANFICLPTLPLTVCVKKLCFRFHFWLRPWPNLLFCTEWRLVCLCLRSSLKSRDIQSNIYLFQLFVWNLSSIKKAAQNCAVLKFCLQLVCLWCGLGSSPYRWVGKLKHGGLELDLHLLPLLTLFFFSLSYL